MNKISVFIAGSAAIALGISSPATAASVTFNFSGVVEGIDDPVFLVGDSIQVGDPFNGSYTFDSTTPDLDPSTQTGQYQAEQLVLSINNTSRPLYTNDVGMTISTAGSDEYFINAQFDINDIFGQRANLFISMPANFLSDALPVAPPNFGSGGFIFDYPVASAYYSLSGTINSITPVPEPASALGTLALGVFGAAGYVLKATKRL